ncbi:hypothetical protein OESDEN_00247 [Oesophagostomum dentatum]|uniref:Uncharacterized protein n=1 Tax=Oesophagostomum dentatum TaxID=61180 RepID=A0A0B1TR61_OESDE|nr:hypothetical protein OESDEN_00247 [Oesophagostomum dentatum]
MSAPESSQSSEQGSINERCTQVQSAPEVSEIQNLQVAIARRYKTVESLKRMCTKKRISVMKANERVEEEVINTQAQLRNGLLTLQMQYECSSSSLSMRRKSLDVLMKITAVRRKTLLMEVSDILHIVIRLDSNQEKVSPCETTTAKCGLEDLANLIGSSSKAI